VALPSAPPSAPHWASSTIRLSASTKTQAPDESKSIQGRVWRRLLLDASPQAGSRPSSGPQDQLGRRAMMRVGPPLPPLIFIGRATIQDPTAGKRSSWATFSRITTLWDPKITWDSNSVDWP